MIKLNYIEANIDNLPEYQRPNKDETKTRLKN